MHFPIGTIVKVGFIGVIRSAFNGDKHVVQVGNELHVMPHEFIKLYDPPAPATPGTMHFHVSGDGTTKAMADEIIKKVAITNAPRVSEPMDARWSDMNNLGSYDKSDIALIIRALQTRVKESEYISTVLVKERNVMAEERNQECDRHNETKQKLEKTTNRIANLIRERDHSFAEIAKIDKLASDTVRECNEAKRKLSEVEHALKS